MKVLALSPHTDDVELGCGGTLARWLQEKDLTLHWVAFSCARESVPEGEPDDSILKEFLHNTRLLGLPESAVEALDLPVRRFDEHRQEILEKLVAVRNAFRPELVLMPSPRDVHQDHQVVAAEAVRAFKNSSSILGYELPWNELSSAASFFVRLERSHVDRKMELLRNYKTQYQKGRSYFSEEFVYGLATSRGVQCNAPFAEAFEVVRWMC